MASNLLQISFLFALLSLCSVYLFGINILYSLLNYDPHPDSNLTTCEIVSVRGLKCQEYFVKTKQGYILTFHRILPLFGASKPGLKPVFIQHGLTGTSLNFVISSEHFSTDPRAGIGHNLGLELARQGYDVWLGNNRGSHFSMRHAFYSNHDPQFWNYTFDDIAREDIPAMIDYILKETNSTKLSYIGHSQGTVVMFALLSNSSNKHYNNVIEPFIALSPVAILKNASTPFRYIVTAMRWIHGDNLDVPVFRKPNTWQNIKNLLCSSNARVICKFLFTTICGNGHHFNESRLGVYLNEHSPSSTSRRNMRHFYQLFNKDKFTRFDHGPEGNIEQYAQEYPPEYELNKINHTSIHLIYSRNDLFAPLDAIETLINNIPNIKESYEIQEPSASHCDPLFGIDIAREVNFKILQILDSYSRK